MAYSPSLADKLGVRSGDPIREERGTSALNDAA
jgi:hypothetical protein